MLGAMRAYREVGYRFTLCSDHVPQMRDDLDFGLIGRAYNHGYIRAMVQAANRHRRLRARLLGHPRRAQRGHRRDARAVRRPLPPHHGGRAAGGALAHPDQSWITRVVSGDVPDLVISSGALFEWMARRGVWADMRPALQRLGWKQGDVFHNPATIAFEGKQHAVPFVAHQGGALVYNKTLFGEAGVPFPTRTGPGRTCSRPRGA